MKLVNLLRAEFLVVLIAPLLFSQCQSSKQIEEHQAVITTNEAFHEWAMMAMSAHKGIMAWIYLPITEDSEQSKNELQALLDYNWPELEHRLGDEAPKVLDKEVLAQVEALMADFDGYREIMREIMDALRTYEDYEDPMVSFVAEDKFTAQLDGQLRDHVKAIQEIQEGLKARLLRGD